MNEIMKISIVKGMDRPAAKSGARILALLGVFLLSVGASDGGVVVTKTLATLIGKITEEKDNLRVTVTKGEVIVPRTQVYWFCADPKVDTKLKAAKLALLLRLPIPVVQSILWESARETPETKEEALQLLKALATPDEPEPTAAAAAGPAGAVQPVGVPRVVDYTISMQSVELAGWSYWGPPSAPSSIRTPIFSTKTLNTSGFILTK
jgi:hypothetical protein